MQRSRPGFSVHIDETADTRLILARMNDCHGRFHFYNARLLHPLNKLCKNLYLQVSQILVRLLLINELTKPPDSITYRQNPNSPNKTKTKRHKRDKNWFKNTSSSPLKRNETHLFHHGPKRFITPKRIPTEDIVSKITRIHQGQHKEQNSFYLPTAIFPYQLQY